ncbi:MAG: restriction endonuclease subunit S [Proteobacteria bacterium]|nr:restriction endonuclease subunit S [Pseudomonadota bacterium]
MRWDVYPDMKDSGVEWIGAIPSEWSVAEVRYLFDVQLGKMLQNESSSHRDTEVPYLKALHVQWDKVQTTELPKMWASPKGLFAYSVVNGDLLVCEGGEVGRAALVDGLDGECIIQNSLHRVRPSGKGIDVRILMYFLEHASSNGWFQVVCNKATIAHLTSEKLGDLPIAVAPVQDSKAIATFLDRKTAAIDALIEKKQRLIELLEEKRQVVISRAVTKGLDPNAKMKDSGVPWLGEIPAHWEVRDLGQLVDVVSGATPSKDNLSYWDGDIPWVSPKDMKRWVISDAIDHVTQKAVQVTTLKLIDPPAVLLVVRGMILLHSVPVAVTDAPVTINQDMKALIPRIEISPLYLMYQLRALKTAVLSRVEESGHGTRCLRTELWRKLSLIVPSRESQTAICNYIERKLTEIDGLLSKTSMVIEKLLEYRQALITAAVTGKIDVRG